MDDIRLSGDEMIRDMVHTCQERIVEYHRKGFAAEQAGDTEAAVRWYRLSQQQNALLRQYWQAGARAYLTNSK